MREGLTFGAAFDTECKRGTILSSKLAGGPGPRAPENKPVKVPTGWSVCGPHTLVIKSRHTQRSFLCVVLLTSVWIARM